VELFTSEGCSDCPPADALLEKLDRSQPIRDVELIVLSEHVDYWNDIGWKDPYSSHEYSERQGLFAGYFGLRSVYTPQMVIDGRAELVGSDERSALRAIEEASKAQKLPVSLASTRFAGRNQIALHVETGPSPSAMPESSAKLLLALADDRDTSSVSRGENTGRTLTHIAVARDLVKVGTLDRSGKFSNDIIVNFNHHDKANLRIVAIVQDSATGAIIGLSSARLSE
jgi:hypothetical protein